MKIAKKLSYIWDYYKHYIIGIPLILLLLVYVFCAFTSSHELPFSIYLINQDILIEEGEALEELLRNSDTLSTVTEDIYVDVSLTITPDTPDFDSQMSFLTSISGHTIDIMIGDETFFNSYCDRDVFMDLSQLLPVDLYESLFSYLIHTENEEGDTVCYAIDISSFSYFREYDLHTPYLTIAKYTEHPDACIAFLHLLCEVDP